MSGMKIVRIIAPLLKKVVGSASPMRSVQWLLMILAFLTIGAFAGINDMSRGTAVGRG